jgi:hypothetical protein
MTAAKYDFNIGDRVAERPKSHGLFAVSKEAEEIVKRNRSQRYGTIVGYDTQLNKSGKRMNMLLVQWDHLKSPMKHARCRICPIDQLDALTKQIIVPGE